MLIANTVIRRCLVSVIPLLLCGSGLLHAQPIEVVEAQPSRVGAVVQRSTQAASAVPNMQGELFVQLQQLQAEVMRLRGLVEEQAHEINLLKQRRMDDYLDLDRRIAELSGTQSDNKPAVGASDTGRILATTKSSASINNVSTSKSDDTSKDVYRSAYQLVKAREFDKAKTAFQSFVVTYPASSYLPNAHYWLGELYYLESNLEQARQSFVLLIEQFPAHRKVSDASFKLGKVYHQLGDVAKAKSLMQQVVREHPGTSAAKLASDYLSQSLR